MIYTVQSSLQTDEPIMLINRHIGFDAEDGMGIDGSLFQQELLELDGMGKKRIQVWINSPGGDVMGGFSIFNAILKSATPVDTYNAGMCASIAGVIFMAGRKRVMCDYGIFMMHNPFGSDDKKMIDAMKNSLVTMLSSKSNITETEVDMLMNRTTWMNAGECFASGFCTDIEVTSQSNKKRMPVNDSRAMWKESNLILNNIFKISNKMIKVTNKLKLQEAANEDAIVAAIEALENSAKATADDLATAKADLDAANKKAIAAEEKYNALKAQADEAEEKAKKAEEDLADVNIKNMVEGFAKVGKIKNDAEVINKWIGTAKKMGLDETKTMLEELPINKSAVKIEIGADSKESGLLNVAAKAMLERREKLGI
jgi:ATP-dependent protease ClpP protease subunit